MTTKLALYNGALVKHLGERKLSSLSENRKPRRVLDTIWDGGFTDEILEAALWNFATRSYQSEYNPSIEPDFGYKYAHDKPEDWIRTSAISLSEYFTDPLIAYNDEAGYIFCDQPTIFIRQVSNDDTYGGNLSIWPESVVSYAEIELASQACTAITQSRDQAAELKTEAARALRSAKGKDAMNDAPKFPPASSWARARRGSVRRGPPTNIRTV